MNVLGLYEQQSLYAGSPIEEQKQLASSVLKAYQQSEARADELQAALTSAKLQASELDDQQGLEYINQVQSNLDTTIAGIAKDAQGNIAWESALKQTKNLANTLKNDIILNNLSAQYIKQQESIAVRNKLRAEGKAPIGFGGADQPFSSYTLAEDGAPILNQFTGFYEPQGDQYRGYGDLYAGLTSEIRDEYESLLKKDAEGTLTEEGTQRLATIDNYLIEQAKELSETNQDYRQLVERFGGNEDKARQHIIENRLHTLPNRSLPGDAERELYANKRALDVAAQISISNNAAANKARQAELEANAAGNTLQSGNASKFLTTSSVGLTPTETNDYDFNDFDDFIVNGVLTAPDINAISEEETTYVNTGRGTVPVTRQLSLDELKAKQDQANSRYQTYKDNLEGAREQLIAADYPNAANLSDARILSIVKDQIFADQAKEFEVIRGNSLTTANTAYEELANKNAFPLTDKVNIHGLGNDGKGVLESLEIKSRDDISNVRFLGWAGKSNIPYKIHAGDAMYEITAINKDNDEITRTVSIAGKEMVKEYSSVFSELDRVDMALNETTLKSSNTSADELMKTKEGRKQFIDTKTLGFPTKSGDYYFRTIKTLGYDKANSMVVPYYYDDEADRYLPLVDMESSNLELLPKTEEFREELAEANRRNSKDELNGSANFFLSKFGATSGIMSLEDFIIYTKNKLVDTETFKNSTLTNSKAETKLNPEG